MVLNAAAVIAFAISTILSIISLIRMLATTQMQTNALVANALLERWDGNDSFRDMERRISDNTFKYNRADTPYQHSYLPKQIMPYLNFLEDVALFHHKGVLDTEVRDGLLGATIIEAYFNNEIRAYVGAVRSKERHQDACSCLQATAEEIKDRPLRRALAKALSTRVTDNNGWSKPAGWGSRAGCTLSAMACIQAMPLSATEAETCSPPREGVTKADDHFNMPAGYDIQMPKMYQPMQWQKYEMPTITANVEINLSPPL